MQKLGANLKDHYTNQFPCPREASKFALKLITLLQGLHEAGYIHNDVCLENICLDANGDLKLIDFNFCTKYNDSLGMLIPEGQVPFRGDV